MYVNVHVDPSDVLDELDDETLESILQKRRKSKPQPTIIDETRELLVAAMTAVRVRDLAEAEFLLERALFPKFESFDKAMFAYAKARKEMHP